MTAGDIERVDFVTPRYWLRGGAEAAVRMLAERVAAQLGWEVHLHATTAVSSATWADEREPGTTVRNGVTIHLHPVDGGRTADWGPLNERVKESPTTVDPVTEAAFFTTQGPVSHSLASAVASSPADLVVFAPYLFWTTVGVLEAVADRALLVPAAHDEPFLRLPTVRRVILASHGLLYGSHAERRLLEATHPVAHLPHTVLGWGIDEPVPADPDRPKPLGLPDDGRPFALCLGRIEHAKGSVGLAEFWRTYAHRRSPTHRLVMAGEPGASIDTDDDLVILGEIDDATKWDLLRAADLLITPSAMESFSLVVLEAWAAGIPVLVNRWCAATYDHARRSEGGLWYADYPTFEVALDRLLGDRHLREQLSERGRDFGARTYGWEAIVGRFETLCRTRLALRSPR